MNKRLNWIDYYKAIGIILVVIGHTCDDWNMYIYQFHMAAFFFISGYCFVCEKGKEVTKFVTRVYSLLVPYFTMFLINLILAYILHRFGVYELLWGEGSYFGVKQTFMMFITGQGNYLWAMGATWFITVLFDISVIWIIMFAVFNRVNANNTIKYISMFVISWLLYLGGFELVNNGGGRFDLAFIGQLYFGLGIITRIIKTNYAKNIEVIDRLFIIILSTVVMIYCAKLPGVTVDYPSRYFHYPILNVLTSVNGIIIIYNISLILAGAFKKIGYSGTVLKVLGKNTVAILYNHFWSFKLVYLLLILAGVIKYDYLVNITPESEGIGRKYWWLFVITACVVSILIWKGITLCKVGKALLGEYSDIVKRKVTTLYSKLKKREGNEHVFSLNTFISRQYENRWFLLSFLFVSVFSLLPMLFKGVILNDELQTWFIRKDGFFKMFKIAVDGELAMGRPLRVLGSVSSNFSFLSTNMYISNAVQILIMICSVWAFYAFAREVFDERIARLAAILVIATMPMTFEHAAPNAFVGLTALPIIWICLSFKYWIAFIDEDNKKYIALSILFWILGLLTYEYVVTYAVVFIMIYLGKKNIIQSGVKDAIKKCSYPIVIALAYIILTLVFRQSTENVYSGAVVGVRSVSGALEIIRVLLLASIPGYFYFNNKYRYLIYIMTGEKYKFLLDKGFSFSNFKNSEYIYEKVCFYREHLLNPRILVCVLAVVLTVGYIVRTKKTNKPIIIREIYKLLCVGVYMVLPIVPNSIAELYQGQVTETFFTRLPVSLNISYTVALFIAAICIYIASVNLYSVKALIISFITVLTIIVQSMNQEIGHEQAENYQRICNIQQFLDTETVANLNNRIIYTEDIVKTYNLLAAPYSYWNNYVNKKGLNIAFTEEKENTSLYYINNDYFEVSNEAEIVVASKKHLDQTVSVRNHEGEWVTVTPESYVIDNGFVCYRFDSKTLENIDDGGMPFSDSVITAGSTMDTMNKIAGIYSDGWCEKDTLFEILFVNSSISIQGYVPDDISDDMKIDVSVDDREYMIYDVSGTEFSFNIDASPGQVHSVALHTNKGVDDKGEDRRPRSFLITNIIQNI